MVPKSEHIATGSNASDIVEQLLLVGLLHSLACAACEDGECLQNIPQNDVGLIFVTVWASS